jgi:hypothetical protein
MRVRASQPVPDDRTLQITGQVWAEDLIAGAIPPSKWETAFNLAARARSSANKAFMVTLDQILDAWEHWLLGDEWIAGADGHDWKRRDVSVVYCGECQQGHRYEEREVEERGQKRVRSVAIPCPCWQIPLGRDSYHYRRFAAAYEIATGRIYEPSDQDLVNFFEIKHKREIPDWGPAADQYCAQDPEPTLTGFAKSEFYKRIRKVAPRLVY